MLTSYLRHTCLLFCILVSCNSCSSHDENKLPGYIEGEYNYIASGMSGTLFTLNVTRGQTIKQNDLLFTLDPEPDQAAMEAAQANVGDLEGQTALAKIQLQRHKDLYVHHATDKSTLDQKQTEYQTKQEQLAAAKNNLAESAWAYHQKTVYSPVSGYVYDTYYRLGEKVMANQPVVALLTPENVQVKFFIPEEQLSTIHLGETIAIRCDSCKTSTKAIISYISPEAEYTPPIIYSQDTRYKLVYLVRAKLPRDVAMNFHPGQPLDVYINEP